MSQLSTIAGRSARLSRKSEYGHHPEPVIVTRTSNPKPLKRNEAKRKNAPDVKTRKRRKTIVKDVVDLTQPPGVVDAESNERGEIVMNNSIPLDAMLVDLNPRKKLDKYFVLQLILRDEPVNGSSYVLYTREGCTGTTGETMTESLNNEAKAVQMFEQKFKQKTGIEWIDRLDESVIGKYRFIPQNYTAKETGYSGATWRYQDEEDSSWNYYDSNLSAILEQLFHEVAYVGKVRYVLDDAIINVFNFNKCFQVNSETRTKYPMRRLLSDDEEEDEEEVVLDCTEDGVEETVAPQSNTEPRYFTRSRNKPNSAAGRSDGKPPQTVVMPPAAIVSNPIQYVVQDDDTEKRRPVDRAVQLRGYSPSDFELVSNEYDVTLNQCNIERNNNKYYRLQFLIDSSGCSYYVWRRWGRVGQEPSASTTRLMGPFSCGSRAEDCFEQWWRKKTGNHWELRHEFERKKFKYVPILVDPEPEPEPENEAKAEAGTQVPESVTNAKAKKEEDEYVPRKVSADDGEDDMDYDVPTLYITDSRMPLGPLNVLELQAGLSVLNEIKFTLMCGANDNELRRLTSTFYTLIPHSFSRAQRPPVIDTENLLKSKYELLDSLVSTESKKTEPTVEHKPRIEAKIEVKSENVLVH